MYPRHFSVKPPEGDHPWILNIFSVVILISCQVTTWTLHGPWTWCKSLQCPLSSELFVLVSFDVYDLYCLALSLLLPGFDHISDFWYSDHAPFCDYTELQYLIMCGIGHLPRIVDLAEVCGQGQGHLLGIHAQHLQQISSTTVKIILVCSLGNITFNILKLNYTSVRFEKEFQEVFNYPEKDLGLQIKHPLQIITDLFLLWLQKTEEMSCH